MRNTQFTNPMPQNRTLRLSSVRKACADVLACVFGRACLLVRHADSTLRQARPHAPPLAGKLHALA